MKYIDKILNESITSSASQSGRPTLVALTRATTNLIYSDLVATQSTRQPVAALYGVKYLNPNKELSFVTGSTYAGQYGSIDRQSMKNLSLSNLNEIKNGELFLYQDVVFKSLSNTPFEGTTETDLYDVVNEAIASSTIRMAPEAAETEKFEATNPDIAEAGFVVNKWQASVRSRKIKTELTVELAQDMERNGLDTPNMLEDLLATQMAEEINKDVMQSLITVSKRFKVAGIPKGVLDISSITSAVEQSRELYRYICEMNAMIQRATAYSATYVVASSRCAAVLASSGWLTVDDEQPDAAYGVLNNGLVVYCDNTSPIEYVVVGVKADYGNAEMVGSLFYAPYSEGISEAVSDDVDHIGAYKIINDPESLQPKIALSMRYALCVNPYTMGIDDEEARIIDATNMDNFAGRSEMSVLLGVKLPKLEQK